MWIISILDYIMNVSPIVGFFLDVVVFRYRYAAGVIVNCFVIVWLSIVVLILAVPA